MSCSICPTVIEMKVGGGQWIVRSLDLVTIHCPLFLSEKNSRMAHISRHSKPVLVILGIMGQTPFAGVAWQVLHYLEGFRRVGYDVYYVEDTGDWPYDPEQDTITGDSSYT